MLWIVGPAAGGKRSLLHGIRQHMDGAKCGDDGELRASPPFPVSISEADASFEETCLAVDTKYYTAQVHVWRQEHIPSITALDCLEDIAGLEGLIVSFDLSDDDEDHLSGAKEWGAFARKRDQIGLRLLVGTKADRVQESSLLDRRREACLSWCLQYGFEFVEVDCLDPHKGGETREKEGIPRVVEAVQSNSWSGLTLKKNASKMVGHAPSALKEEDGDDSEGEDYFAGTSYGALEDDGGESQWPAFPDPSEEAAPLDPEGHQEEEGMGDLTLEHLMAEVQRVRAECANLPDDKRRELASSTALKLLEHLHIADDSDISD